MMRLFYLLVYYFNASPHIIIANLIAIAGIFLSWWSGEEVMVAYFAEIVFIMGVLMLGAIFWRKKEDDYHVPLIAPVTLTPVWAYVYIVFGLAIMGLEWDQAIAMLWNARLLTVLLFASQITSYWGKGGLVKDWVVVGRKETIVITAIVCTAIALAFWDAAPLLLVVFKSYFELRDNMDMQRQDLDS